MIWFRRVLAIPLIVVSVVLLTVLLPVTQLNDTAANPRFYEDRLEQADVYDFVYDEALPAALDELEADDLSDSPIALAPIRDDLVSAARKVLPPDWLRAQAESAIEAVVPYVAGGRDSFTLTIDLRDRVETAAAVIKQDIVRGNAFSQVYSDGISYLADELFDNLDELPYTITLTRAEIETALSGVLPADWAAAQIEAAIDSVLPYLTGDAEHFTITVRVIDLVDPAASAAIDVLSRQETYDFLVEELIAPMVAAGIGPAVDLGYGITLSRDEVSAAIEEVLTPEWLQARLEEMVNGIAAYAKGDAGTFEIAVDLGDLKEEALDVMTGLADDRLRALFLSLPECSMSQFLQAIVVLPPDTLPSCRPFGVSYEDAKGALGVDVRAEIDQAIGDRIPDKWSYTESDLRQLLSRQGDAGFLDEARERVMEGWTFTDTDLMEKLDTEGTDALQDARGWIRDGYTVTESDLRDAVSDSGDDLRSFDDARHWAHTGRTLLWVAWPGLFLLLLVVGVLGGRNWPSRLAWALVVLFLASLTFYIVTGAVYSTVGKSRLQDGPFDTAEYEGVAAVVAEKGNEIVVDSVNSYVSGMRGKAIFIVIGSAAGLAGVIVWSRRRAYDEARRPADAGS